MHFLPVLWPRSEVTTHAQTRGLFPGAQRPRQKMPATFFISTLVCTVRNNWWVLRKCLLDFSPPQLLKLILKRNMGNVKGNSGFIKAIFFIHSQKYEGMATVRIFTYPMMIARETFPESLVKISLLKHELYVLRLLVFHALLYKAVFVHFMRN